MCCLMFSYLSAIVYASVLCTNRHTRKYTPKKFCQENENVSSLSWWFQPKMNLWRKSDLLHVRSNETCYINIHTKNTHTHTCGVKFRYTQYYTRNIQKAKGYIVFSAPIRYCVFVNNGFYAEIIRKYHIHAHSAESESENSTKFSF